MTLLTHVQSRSAVRIEHVNIIHSSAHIFDFAFQPIPNRREERPVSCFVPGSGPMMPNMSALARDVVNAVKDKQRAFVPSMISNETYGTMLDVSPPPPGFPGAPGFSLPPRTLGRGELHTGNV